MSASGWPVTLLLLRLFGSASSSPVSIHTRAPPLSSQILSPSPFPTILPPPPSPSVSIPSQIPPSTSSSAESSEEIHCPLIMSPSTLVVRFGDPVSANCSIQQIGFPLLGWEVPLEVPEPSPQSFLVWSVEQMTEWDIKPMCYALSEQGGKCDIGLPITVYQPPDSVSISFVNHSGPMLEGDRYTLQCTVLDVAPVESLTVTFYMGHTVLGSFQSNNTEKTPVTEIFTLDVNPSKDDNMAQYWCEARLELGPEGPQHSPVVASEKLSTVVLFGPQLICPKKLQVKEGESLECEVAGNPQPLVTWYRDGQVIALPAHSNRGHAGKYTVWTKGLHGQKNFTVEVEVLGNSGNSNIHNGHLILVFLLLQMLSWL